MSVLPKRKGWAYRWATSGPFAPLSGPGPSDPCPLSWPGTYGGETGCRNAPNLHSGSIMTLPIARLGTLRHPQEGTRGGAVRCPPRGVRKDRYAAENWFDV